MGDEAMYVSESIYSILIGTGTSPPDSYYQPCPEYPALMERIAELRERVAAKLPPGGENPDLQDLAACYERLQKILCLRMFDYGSMYRDAYSPGNGQDARIPGWLGAERVLREMSKDVGVYVRPGSAGDPVVQFLPDDAIQRVPLVYQEQFELIYGYFDDWLSKRIKLSEIIEEHRKIWLETGKKAAVQLGRIVRQRMNDAVRADGVMMDTRFCDFFGIR